MTVEYCLNCGHFHMNPIRTVGANSLHKCLGCPRCFPTEENTKDFPPDEER